MPRIKILGDSINTGDLGARQVRGNHTTRGATPAIEVKKACRNGQAVSAQYQNLLNESTNAAACYRTKQLFWMFGDLGSAPGIQATSTAGTRARWRGAFRTGPYHHAIIARAVMFPPSSNYANNTNAILGIYSDATETTLVATATFYYGPGPTGTTSAGGWQYQRIIDIPLDSLSADTEYFCRWSDVNYGRLQSGVIIDLQSMTQGYSGYLSQQIAGDTEVVHVHRQNVAAIQKQLWKRSGAAVVGWTANIQASAPTTTSATLRNVLDNSSTTVSAATPGWTIDMRNKTRLSQTTVPCVMKVCAQWDGAGTAGTVQLKSSDGTVVATIVDGWASGTRTWVSVAVNMPATLDKYDLWYSVGSGGGGAVFAIFAVSIWEHET